MWVKAGLAVGTKVAARYSVDRTMYAAVIEAVSERGYVVLYTDYGNREEVPAEWVSEDLALVGTNAAADSAQEQAPPLVKNVAAGAGGAAAASNRKRKKAAEAARRAEMEAKLKVIPDSLKITAEDTEAQKKKKVREVLLLETCRFFATASCAVHVYSWFVCIVHRNASRRNSRQIIRLLPLKSHKATARPPGKNLLKKQKRRVRRGRCSICAKRVFLRLQVLLTVVSVSPAAVLA